MMTSFPNLAALGWLGLATLGLASQSGVKLAIVNESPSLQRGLYLRAPRSALQTGSIVALAPPPAARAYLAGLGFPPDALLLKRVAGLDGDLVCVGDGEVETPRGAAPVRDRDRRGRDLPQWRGCERLAAGEVFLLGDTDDSFDSRYFGPVRSSALKGVFRAVATW